MDREEIERKYRELRQSGLSHDEAVSRINAMGGARPSVPQQQPRGQQESRGAVEEFARGAGLGLAEAGTSLAQGVGWLGRKVLPGEALDRPFEALERGAGQLEERAERALDPRGTAGSVGRFVGRLGGEVATTAATLGAGRAASLRYAPKALEAARRITGGGRLGSAIAATAAESVPSVVRAGGEAAEGRSFGQELALELGGSALGGALVPLGRAARGGLDVPTSGIAPEIPVDDFSRVSEGAFSRAKRAVEGLVDAPGERWQGLKDVMRKHFTDRTLPLLRAVQRDVGAREARELEYLLSQRNSAGRMAIDEFNDRLGGIIGKGDEYANSLSQYIAARRGLNLLEKRGSSRLINRNTNKPFTKSELQEIIRRGEATEGIVEDAQEVSKFYRDLLDLQKDVGLISQKQYDAITKFENVPGGDIYAPFYRSFAEAAEGNSRWFNRQFGPSPKARRFSESEVSDLNLLNPLVVAASESQAVFDAAAKQQVVNLFAAAEKRGAFGESGLIRRVPRGYKPKPDEKIVSGRINGKRVSYVVEDEEVYDAMVGEMLPGNNIIQRIARGFTTVKRNTITALPGFAALSLARDIPAYALQRRDVGRALLESAAGAAAGGAVGGAIGGDVESALIGAGIGSGVGGIARPAAEIGSAVSALTKQTKLGKAGVNATRSVLRAMGQEYTPKTAASERYLRQWVDAGGVTESFYARSQEDARKLINSIKRDHQNIAQSIVSFGSWVDTLQAIGRIAERAPRVAEFRRAMEAGEGINEAILRSHDVTLNFAKKGATAGKLAPYAAFFNAKLQGWDKLARMMTDSKTYALGVPLILAPTAALWSLNKDNPAYWERPEWEKNIFWLIPDPTKPDGFIRVPKPFELGTALASSFERLFDGLARSGSIATDVIPPAPDLTVPRALSGLVSAGLGFLEQEALPFPDIVKAPAEQIFNYDLFRGRSIVPMGLQQLPGEAQYSERTGALPRLIGQATGFSPVRAEKLLSDLFGTVGTRVQDVVIDPAARAAGLPAPVEERPGRSLLSRVGEAVGVERFRTSEQSVSQIEYDARRAIQSVEEVKRQFDKLVNEGASDQEIDRFYRNNIDAFEKKAAMDDARIALGRLDRQRREISRDRSISDVERKEALDRISDLANEVSRYILEIGSR